ncbi:unnamed protein product [Prunus armeniaca]|uniref:WPP domain-associated protein n=1 Tax=Prunus armeniaca TaxID=36596 RepID=A0A6J5WHE3_PRUAR|nr:unnamed protein product [Prunus armeniaca]
MDSTMMRIVHQAMNNAHEKMQSKEGVLQRLNEISRFYELAVMQLEGCLKFVRQETDSCILESSHEQVLTDLTEIRNRLQGRLKESEMAIMAKDRELASLRSSTANLKLERRTKSEPVEEYIFSNRMGGDDEEDDDDDRDNELFCELKNSVDQQVLNIRQKLQPDYRFKDKEGNSEVVEGINNKKIEQMGSDMGILKETLDLAFGKMQNAIFRSEVGPIEQQWRWDVEKDTMSALLQGFMSDFQETVEAQVWKEEEHVCLGLKEYWYDLMDEVVNLRHELDSFVGDNEVVQVKCTDPLQTSLGGKVSNRTNEKHSPEDFNHGKPEYQLSLKAEEVMQEVHEEERGEDGGHFVSKMIKNHESIIRKKSAEVEELNLLKREILRQKGNLSSRREEIGMQENSLKRRVQEIILKLDKLRDWDVKLNETFGNYECNHEEETLSEERFLKSDANHIDNLELDTLEDVWKKMDKVPYAINEELQNEGSRLKQDQEEENLKSVIMERTYVTLLESLIKENRIELHDFELENLIWKDICNLVLTEVVNQWLENIKGNNIESRTREEIYCTVLREAIKDYSSNGNFALVECQDLRVENNSLNDSAFSDKFCYLEGTIREDVCWTLLHEMLKEWNECIYGCETESLLREEVDWLICNETIKEFVKTAGDPLAQYQDIVTREFLQITESFVREDICMVFIREMIKEWKMESLSKEEIFQFVMVEVLRDAFDLFSEADSRTHDKFPKGMLFANKLQNDRQVGAEENLNEKIGTEEDLMSSESSKGLLTKFHTFSSVSSKLASKALGSELGSSLDIVVGGLQKVYDQVSPAVGSAHSSEPSYCQPKTNKEVQLNPPDSVFTPVLRFQEVLVDLEHTSKEKLEINFLRLDKMRDGINILVEHVSTLRKKESLYRNAFTRRCQDLWKAETEVDLLGDQVDVLAGLLEKIYTILCHHSLVLQQYFEVSDILQLIKKELTGAVNTSKN